jgi:hypothetical protein
MSDEKPDKRVGEYDEGQEQDPTHDHEHVGEFDDAEGTKD